MNHPLIKVPEAGAPHSIVPVEMSNQELGVSIDPNLSVAEISNLFQGDQEGSVFGSIVGSLPDETVILPHKIPSLGLQDYPDPSRTWISTGGTINVNVESVLPHKTYPLK